MEYIIVNPEDNVAVAIENLQTGMKVNENVILRQEIKTGHKFALKKIDYGDPVIKYGNSIGYAQRPIEAGEWVHIHNLSTGLKGIKEYEYKKRGIPASRSSESLFFNGFVRANGCIGVRNEIWIIPTVGCVNSTVRKIAEMNQNLVEGSLEGIFAVEHPYGCSQAGEDQENTRNLLAALCAHPNAGGILLVGLGCENTGVNAILQRVEENDKCKICTLICQEQEDEFQGAGVMLKQMAEKLVGCTRSKVPVSELIVGVKCGGSDGLSGITANPMVGEISNFILEQGASIVMSEVPEMFGAEQILLDRCRDTDTFYKTAGMINCYKRYFIENHEEIYENPSPGNKDGGISTLEEKSLGCIQKSGKYQIEDALSYGMPVIRKGMNLLYGPGNDIVAVTGLAASGAHIILFTTGRGTPLGSMVPVIKISTNTALYEKKRQWIDFNCGELIEGVSGEAIKMKLIEYILALCSGEKQTASERAGIKDFSIFKTGVTL